MFSEVGYDEMTSMHWGSCRFIHYVVARETLDSGCDGKHHEVKGGDVKENK